MEDMMKAKREPRNRRFALALTQSDYDRLERLSQVTQKPPAVCVREILMRYLKEHEEEINAAKIAIEDYLAAKKRLKSKQMSLFNDEEEL